MVVQYLKELMSIYTGTSMKLLMKKSDFSAVEKNKTIRYCKILNVSRNLHILG
jgi:hypothetical protein